MEQAPSLVHEFIKRAPLTIAEVGYTPSPVQLNLIASLGAEAIGVWISQIIWGVNIVHFIRYFDNFREDHWLMKSTVGLLLIMDILTSVMSLRLEWFWNVLTWGNANALGVFDPSFFVDIAMTGLTPTVVQWYFAYRVFVVSGKRAKIMPILIMFTAVWQAAFCLTVVVMVWNLGVSSKFGDALWAIYCWFLGGAISDVLITFNMLYWIYVAKQRTEFKATRSVLNQFTVLVFETNALTTIGALSILVVFATTHNKSLAYNAISYVVTKWYTLSLLIATNSRIKLRREFEDRTAAGPTVPSHHIQSGQRSHGIELSQAGVGSQIGMRSHHQAALPTYTQGIKVTNFTVVDEEDSGGYYKEQQARGRHSDEIA